MTVILTIQRNKKSKYLHNATTEEHESIHEDQNDHNTEQNICKSDHDEAICNMLIDSDTNLFNDEWNPKTAKTLVKSLQPFREMPSKDRRRRFAAGTLYGDGENPSDHNVSLFEF